VIPASGLVPPLRILVAVRAIAPVAAIPPNSGERMLAMPVRHHRRQQRLDRPQHGDGEGRWQQRHPAVETRLRQLQARQAARNRAEGGLDGRHPVQMQRLHGHGRHQHRQQRSRYP
jgi:hypothetical protein